MGWKPIGTDEDAIHDNVAGEIDALSEVTPVAGDWVIGEDTSDGDSKVKFNTSHFLGGGGGGGKSYVTIPAMRPPDSPVTGDIEFLSHANGVDPTVGPGMTWGNQGGASAQVDQGRLVMNSATVNNLRALLIATPGSGNFTVDTLCQAMQWNNTHVAFIVMLWGTPGTPTAIRAAGRYWNSGIPTQNAFVYTTYNTSWVATVDDASMFVQMGLEPFALRVEWDGTNLIYKASPSAIAGTFVQVTSQAEGLGRPDYIGLGVNTNNAATPSIAAFNYLRFNWTADFDPTTDD
jgi:hypothetical protein